ncbi:hypothetical protein [Burkholderia vietnamiensis]|uniref:hypothetical protein n=1 Tax=Burkholderia vietnamiensis TaxID=60552 RepID=UPI001593FF86|nr:hypothetical protein [Burkholderia vietnamiensis]MCA8228381.1 hypothetical protein [Burkholderia vietnamiensis]
MFNLNRKDAEGLLEDVAMLGTLQRRRRAEPYTGPTAEQLARDQQVRDLRSENVKIATRELQAHNALVESQKKVAALSYDYADLVAAAKASRGAIDSLVAQLATATGQPVEQVRKATYQLMSAKYDAAVDEMLSLSQLTKDPRKDAEVRRRASRDWYYEAQP